jgi:hypothetical protein
MEIVMNQRFQVGVVALQLFVGVSSGTAVAATKYEIEVSKNDETFVINGELFKAKTYCFDFDEGDDVIFIEGSANGICTSAEILNMRNKKLCRVWCE